MDCGESTPPETIKETLTSLPNQLLDFVDHLVASGIVVRDLPEALDKLVAEGILERKEVQRGNDEPAVYYRPAD